MVMAGEIIGSIAKCEVYMLVSKEQIGWLLYFPWRLF